MEPVNLEKRQSTVIDALRFPLIVLVLIIHILPQDLKPLIPEFSSMAAYRFFSEMISHNIGRIAVPFFFIFSGYFFFLKMKEWSSGFYFTQSKKRVTTLLIPYLLWNILLILVIYLKIYVSGLLSADASGEVSFLKENSFLQLLWMPVDLPLWFLRDLICMTILVPLFYYLFRYTKVYGLLAILAIYLAVFELPVTGFSTTAFLYFGAGAYFGLYKKNMLALSLKLKHLSLFAAIPLLLLATFYNGVEPIHEYLIRIFIPVGIIASTNIMHAVIDNEKIRNLFIRLSPTVLFIFAIHEFYLKNWLKGLFYRTPLSETGLGMLAGYIVMPFILLLVCLGLYYLWERVSPRTLAILSGGRTIKTSKDS